MGSLVVTESGVTVFFVTAAFTVTLHFSFFFPAFAVMVAFPFFLAFTTPFLLTAATFFLLEDHLTVPLYFFTFSFAVFPIVNDNLVFDNFGLTAACDSGQYNELKISAKVVANTSCFFIIETSLNIIFY